MRSIGIILKKELRCIFFDPTSYGLFCVFLLVAIYFFFNLLGSFNQAVIQQASIGVTGLATNLNLNDWVIDAYFQTLLLQLVIFSPFLASSSIAAERASRSFDILVTLPLTSWQIILAKYFSVWIIINILLVLAGSLTLILFVVSQPEIGPIISGIFGLCLAASAFSAITLACSSIVNNSILAGVLSLAILLTCYAIHMPSESYSGSIQEVLRYLSPLWQLKEWFKGMFTLKAVVYFFTITLLALLLAVRGLNAERMRS